MRNVLGRMCSPSPCVITAVTNTLLKSNILQLKWGRTAISLRGEKSLTSSYHAVPKNNNESALHRVRCHGIGTDCHSSVDRLFSGDYKKTSAKQPGAKRNQRGHWLGPALFVLLLEYCCSFRSIPMTAHGGHTHI